MVLKVSPAGKVSTAAGGGPTSSPFLGDGGPATSATVNPLGVAVDNSGNLYIADTGNNRIRKVSTNGTISTVAGPGSPMGPLGDGGPAISATLSAPNGVAVDSLGNIFVADTGANRVRKISPGGIITTVAGNGQAPPTGGLLGDGGPATSASLLSPAAVAPDSAGDLYISDTGNNRIRKVSPAGIITTVAGNGSSTSYGDGGQATLAGIPAPRGIAADATGNIYISDTGGRLVRVVTSGGNINAVAGGGTVTAGFSVTAPATSSFLIGPYGVALGSGGNIYVSDDLNLQGVWQLTPSSTPNFPPPLAVDTIAASAFPGPSPQGVSGSIALGGWIEIYGSYLASDSRSWAGADFTGVNAPASLDGTSVTIGGQPAVISYISAAQLNAQAPSNIGTGAQPMVITTANGSSSTYAVTVNPVQPGILATPAFQIKGVQYVVALFPDGVTYVLPTGAIPGVASRPAQQGDTITLYGIGFGPTTPSTPAGQITQAGNSLVLPPKVYFDASQAVVSYAGLAPGVVGLYQFNVVVPKLPNATPIMTIAFSLDRNISVAGYIATAVTNP
jgi:uncharacterized protein (TIGR03437 family)